MFKNNIAASTNTSFHSFCWKSFLLQVSILINQLKISQDDLAGLCLINFNKRSNKWTNQDGTYVRAPCPGLWELGPCTLPKLTVSLYSICHELKDYLERREPDALQFGCLTTSVTAGFPLVATEAGVAPRVGTGRAPAHGLAGPPRDCSTCGGRRQAVKPEVTTLPIYGLVSSGRSCATPSERLMLDASPRLKTEYGIMTHSI